MSGGQATIHCSATKPNLNKVDAFARYREFSTDSAFKLKRPAGHNEAAAPTALNKAEKRSVGARRSKNTKSHLDAITKAGRSANVCFGSKADVTDEQAQMRERGGQVG
jgi:hypothetical protein